MLIAPHEVPVEPEAPEAREWLIRELADPRYEAARPNWFDLLAQRIADWFASLSFDVGEGAFPWWLVVLLGIVAVVVLLAFFIAGPPRRNRRGSMRGTIFGADDARDAAAMRQDAAAAAARGDYAEALAELYRALARGLDERSLVSILPGTTAHAFATAAGRVFPAARDGLELAARDFDAVRYLGAPGTREQWESLVALEGELRTVRTPSLPGAGR